MSGLIKQTQGCLSRIETEKGLERACFRSVPEAGVWIQTLPCLRGSQFMEWTEGLLGRLASPGEDGNTCHVFLLRVWILLGSMI